MYPASLRPSLSLPFRGDVAAATFAQEVLTTATTTARAAASRVPGACPVPSAGSMDEAPGAMPGQGTTPLSATPTTMVVARLSAEWGGLLVRDDVTIGSLFSGIGGLELGLEWAGLGPVKWQVEQDAFCCKVLEKHWPDATRFRDVREVGVHNLEPVDVICGGFPCQDLSYAGKGAGLGGSRSGLWTEYARIVRELRPAIVVVENVAALLGRGLGTVLGDLAACGYDAVWDCIPAASVGAPHRRDRLFIVAYRRCGSVPVERRPPPGSWSARRD